MSSYDYRWKDCIVHSNFSKFLPAFALIAMHWKACLPHVGFPQSSRPSSLLSQNSSEDNLVRCQCHLVAENSIGDQQDDLRELSGCTGSLEGCSTLHQIHAVTAMALSSLLCRHSYKASSKPGKTEYEAPWKCIGSIAWLPRTSQKLYTLQKNFVVKMLRNTKFYTFLRRSGGTSY